MQTHDPGAAARRRTPLLLATALVAGVVLLVVLTGRDLPRAPRSAVTDALVSVGVTVGLVVVVTLLVGGLVMAIGSRRARRRTSAVGDAARLEQAASAPLLARVWAPEDPTTLPALQPGSQSADPFHNLTLWWEAEARRGPVGPVVVSALTAGAPGSSSASDLDAWWAANLAIALSGTGRTTLLVDARMGQRLGATEGDVPDTPGLHDVLTGTAFELALSPGPAPGLSVLPPGRVGIDPDPALLETGFAEVARQAEEHFDAVVVLAPALDQGPDAQVMAASGCLLVVVPQGRVGLAAVRSRAVRVRTAGGHLAGVLLVERRRPRVGG